MSESSASENSGESKEPKLSKDSAAQSEPRVSRFKRWRKRIWRLFIICLFGGFLLRMVVFFILPPVMRKVAAGYGYDLTFQRQELTLTGGDVGLWYLKITPKSGGAPLLQTDYVRGSISTFELFKGRLLVYRAEADGVDVVIERSADGHIAAIDQFLANQTAPPTATPAKSKPGDDQLDFSAPLKIEAFRLAHARATIADNAVTPPLKATVAMDVRVNGLGLVDRPVQFDVDIWSTPVLDTLRISGQGRSKTQNLDASAQVFMRGLHLPPLAGYLEPMGLKPVSSDIGFDLQAKVKAAPLGENKSGVKATLNLDGIVLTADGAETASLKTLQIDVDSLDTKSAMIGLIQIETGRLQAIRGVDGLLQVCGIALTGGKTPPTTAPTPAPVAPPPTSASPFAVKFLQITIKDMIASLRDLSVKPANEINAVLTEVCLNGKDVDAKNPDAKLPIRGHLTVPGIAESIDINGNVKPFTPKKTLELGLSIEHIRPDALRTYLTPIGIESLFKDGSVKAQLTAAMRTGLLDAQVDGLKLSDGGDLAAFEKIHIKGLGVDATSGRTKVESVEIAGPDLSAVRDAQGRVVFANLRFSDAPPQSPRAANAQLPSSAPTTAPSAAPFTLAALPRIEIGQFSWTGLRVHVRDEEVKPATTLAIEDAAVELKDFIFDMTSKAESKPGTLHVHLSSPQLVEKFDIDGTLQSGVSKFDLALKVNGSKIKATELAPYLAPLGIEPTLRNGSVQLEAEVAVAQESGKSLKSSLELKNISMKEGATELGGIDSLRVNEVAVAENGIEIESIQINKPRARIARDENATTGLFGVRLGIPTTQPLPPVSRRAPSTQATTQMASQNKRTPITLHKFTIDGMEVGWADRSLLPAASATAQINVEVKELAFAKPSAPPATFQTTVKSPGILDELIVDGKLAPDPDKFSAQASIKGRGIRAGTLASYLPDRSELSTKDGRFRATLDAGVEKHPEGGTRAHLMVSDVDWRDGDANDPLFAFEKFQFTLGRLDEPGDVLTIDEISLADLRAAMTMGTDGSLDIVGLRSNSSTAKPVVRVAQPTTRGPTAPAITAPQEDVASLIAEARRPLPVITVSKIDLNVKSVTVQNLAEPESKPLVAENIRFRNIEKIDLGGKRPEKNQPAKLELTAQVTPLVDKFTLSLAVDPFANQPTVELDVLVSGIHGAALTDFMPSLKSKLDGSELTDGRLHTHLDAKLKLDRRGPRDFDPARAFMIEQLTITGPEFGNGEGGPILAGLTGIQLEQAKVSPKTGSMAAKRLEITKPQARAYHDAAGIHAMGFTILQPPKGTSEPAPAAQSPPKASEEGAEAKAPTPKATTRPAGEIRFERITVTGLDVIYEDRAVKPQFVLPLNNLDAEVRDFTTLTFYEPRPFRFAALLNSDKVSLPIVEKGGGIAGAIGGIAGMVVKKEATSRPMEQREFFSQIATTGRMGLYPAPRGYVKTAINGVELAALQGLAADNGVDLHGGVFDGNIELRFRDDDITEVYSKLIFTDLSLAEPKNGPISKFLALPAPLDAVITVLEAPDGSITLPINVDVKGTKPDGIGSAAGGAFLKIVTTALAGAPVKVVQGAADITGISALLGSKGKAKIPDPIVIPFAAGSTYLDDEALKKIQSAVEIARKDAKLQLTVRHELGPSDIAIAAVRANPPKEDALALAQRYRARKLALNEQRSNLAGQLRAQLASLPADQNQATVEQLRSLDRQIANVELSLDQLYDLLRPGADRQADRRTRSNALQIAQDRLSAVNTTFVGANIPNSKERISFPAAQFNPTESGEGGRIIITFVGKK